MWRILLYALWVPMWLPACSDGPGPGATSGYPEGLVLEDARGRGRELFLQYCALCHGASADGRGVRAQDLSGPPRDFTNPLWREGQGPGRVFDTVKRGIPGTSMPSWVSLSDEQLWDLVAYVMSVAEEGP